MVLTCSSCSMLAVIIRSVLVMSFLCPRVPGGGGGGEVAFGFKGRPSKGLGVRGIRLTVLGLQGAWLGSCMVSCE